MNGKQKSIDVMEIPNFSAYHNFEFEPRGIRVSKAYSVGEGKTANYTNIVDKPQGTNSIVVRWSNFFFDISVKKCLNSKQSVTVSEASTLFPCSSSFQSFKSLQRYLNYGQCENKTNQESVYYQLLCDWVARFITLLPENRPRAKSGVSSVTSSSLPLWDGRFKGQELVEQGAPLM